MIKLNDAVVYKWGDNWKRERVQMVTENGLPVVENPSYEGFLVLGEGYNWYKVGVFTPSFFGCWDFKPAESTVQ